MAAAYVTLAVAKAHLRITGVDHDDDVQQKTDAAEAIVVDYLTAGRSRWPLPDLPLPATGAGLVVQAAILDLLAGMYEHRGDDLAADVALWEAVARKLARLRDPALA